MRGADPKPSRSDYFHPDFTRGHGEPGYLLDCVEHLQTYDRRLELPRSKALVQELVNSPS